MRLEDISKDKNTIGQRIIENQDICKALYYRDKSFLDQPDIPDTGILLYRNIFPYRHIPGVSDEAMTYLTMSFRAYKPVNTEFKSGLFYIYTFTHRDLIETNYGFLRYDFIVSKIDEMMNQQRGIGIGKNSFHSMDEFDVNEKYLGVVIAYKLWEFN